MDRGLQERFNGAKCPRCCGTDTVTVAVDSEDGWTTGGACSCTGCGLYFYVDHDGRAPRSKFYVRCRMCGEVSCEIDGPGDECSSCGARSAPWYQRI